MFISVNFSIASRNAHATFAEKPQMYVDSLNKQTHANLIQTYESAIDIFALRVTWNYDYIPSKNFKMINQRKAVYLESPVHPIPSPLNTYIHLFNCISVLTHFIWK